MNKKSPVGFFDSGIGGLSVYSKFRKLMPNENTLYYGDLINMPYGNKTPDELLSFARKILNFFSSLDVKAVVIACNTSSAVVYDKIKDEYGFKIYPIIQSCAKVIASNNFNNVVVFATSATVKTSAYKREINKYSQLTNVYEIPCPLWTSFVESGNIKSKECYIDVKNKAEDALRYKPDKIILGCTHYPYLTELLSDFVPDDMLLDPAEIFTEYIYNDLKNNELLNPSPDVGSEHFYVSADKESFINNSKLFYNVTECKQL